MPKKFKFRPFMLYAEPTKENLEKLNSIRSIYYGFQESGIPMEEIAMGFYRAVGGVLMGKRLYDLELEHVEFER